MVQMQNQSPEQKWTIKLIEDPKTGDLILPLTSGILNQVGWDEGDTLIWEELDNGSFSIRKKEKE